MTTMPEPPDPTPLDEQLVAYLDGELDEESHRQIETLLSSDPALRDRLERLGKAWKMLDLLDQPEVKEDFSETTLELVAVAAEQDAEIEKAEAPRQHRRRRAMLGVGVLVAGVISFLGVALLRPDPDRVLLDNLPVVENFDQYRQIDSVDQYVQIDSVAFLRELRKAGLFTKDPPDEP